MKKLAMPALTAAGLALMLLGLGLLKHAAPAEGVMAALPYLCVGIGCGALGHGLGAIIGRQALKGFPDRQKQMDIERNDERNVSIANRAKGKAYDAMLCIYGALFISFALMEAPVYIILLLVFAYLLVVGISIYYRCKYEKEM